MCVPTPVRDNRGRWFELGHPTLWALTREFISPYVYRQTVLSTTFDLERIWTHGERVFRYKTWIFYVRLDRVHFCPWYYWSKRDGFRIKIYLLETKIISNQYKKSESVIYSFSFYDNIFAIKISRHSSKYYTSHFVWFSPVFFFYCHYETKLVFVNKIVYIDINYFS